MVIKSRMSILAISFIFSFCSLLADKVSFGQISKKHNKTHSITYITKLPYTIKRSGIYTLACDLAFNPKTDATNAITINENVIDVDLDLKKHTLSMCPNTTTADNNGVLINSGCQNILIHNGTIHGFSASQIRGYELLNTIEVRDMVLEGLPGGSRMVTETVASGVNLGAIVEAIGFVQAQTTISSNIKLSNLVIRGFLLNNQVIADQAIWGSALFFCNNIEIDNVQVSQLTNSSIVSARTSLCDGFGFQSCMSSITRHCTVADLLSASPNNAAGNVTGDAIGMLYSVCDRVESYDCSFRNAKGTRRCGGITWAGTNNFLAERCVAENNTVANPAANGVASRYGFEAVGNITAAHLPPVTKGVIKDCHVLNQQNCFLAQGATDIIYEGCTATAGNLTPEVAGNNTEGFETFGSNGVTFKQCIATGFDIPGDTTSNIKAGFLILNSSPSSLSTNINILGCKSTKSTIGIYVGNGTTNVVVDSNEAAFNTVTGIQDVTPGQTPNLYIRNLAFANPVNYTINTASPNSAFLVTNISAGYPLYTSTNASPLSNYDIRP